MTQIELDQLKMIITAATPGPWEYRPKEHDDWGIVRGPDGLTVLNSAPPCRWEMSQTGKPEGPSPIPENGNFCVAARNEMPKLIEKIERLKKAIWLLKTYAGETYRYWDTDQDSKVGKRLAAMAGFSPGYNEKIDEALGGI